MVRARHQFVAMTYSLKKQKGRAYEKLRDDDKAELDNAEVLWRAI
jgi:hypothetical protein